MKKRNLILGMALSLITLFSNHTEAKALDVPAITVDKSEYSNGNCRVYFTINGAPEGGVTLNIGDEISKVLLENVGYVTPSDQYTATVHITNNTDGALAYQKGSMNLGADTTPIPGRAMTDFTGYNGAKIPLTHVASMDTGHLAMRQLFDKRIGRKDWNLVLSVYDLLAEKGYTGGSRISDYLLDFYKNKYGEPELTWQSLEQNHWDDVINDFAGSGTSVYFDLTPEEYARAQNTSLGAYVYPVGQYSNGNYQVQLKWPEEAPAAFSYNAFYKDLFAITFADEKPSIHTGMRTRGVGDYADKTGEAYTVAESYISQMGHGGILEKGESTEFVMTLTFEGFGIGNMYMGYQFGNLFNMSLNFERAVKDITITKQWQDADDQDGLRPTQVTVNILADGEVIDKPVTVTAAEGWTKTVTNLPKYQEGREIVYTIKETPVPGYESKVEGYGIINTHTPEVTTVTGTKVWRDDDNRDGKRPAGITVKLVTDGEVLAEQTVTENEDWSWSFDNLPKYNKGRPIKYSVIEDAVPGYTAIYEENGNITNKYTPGKIGITVIKSWKDGDNADSIRPRSITVNLLADGKPTGKTLVLNTQNSWRGGFTDLPEYENGKKITYTVTENPVSGYTSQIRGDVQTGFVITNRHTPTTKPGTTTTTKTTTTTNTAKSPDTSDISGILALTGAILTAAAGGVLKKRNDKR